MASIQLSSVRPFSLDPRDQRASWRQIALICAAAVALAVFFWTQSRYPQLNEKQLMGARSLIDALAFDTITVAKSGDGFFQRVGINTLNWYYTNARGMIFGVLFASLFLSLLTLVSFVSSRSVFVNTLAGLFIGAPMGICTNCVAPISKSLREGGGRLETALATQLSSPTLNIVVVAMLFGLIPLSMAIAKLALTLALILLVVPLLTKHFFTRENDERAVGDISCSLTVPWPEQSWAEAIRGAVRVEIKSLAFVARTTLPLMVLAGLLGGAVMELVPLGTLADLDFSLVGGILIAGLGTFLPVPIAFDIIFVNIMLSVGLDPAYCMIFLFTLGPFSIYPFMLLWRSFSPRVVTVLSCCVFGIGLVSGFALYEHGKFAEAENLAVIERSRGAPDPVQITDLIMAGCDAHEDEIYQGWCERTHLSQVARRLRSPVPCNALQEAFERAACIFEARIECDDIDASLWGACVEQMAIREAENRVTGLKRTCASVVTDELRVQCERWLPYQRAIFGRPEECAGLGSGMSERCADYHVKRAAIAAADSDLCARVRDPGKRVSCLVSTEGEPSQCAGLDFGASKECRLRLALSRVRSSREPRVSCSNAGAGIEPACSVELDVIARLRELWKEHALGVASMDLRSTQIERHSRSPAQSPPTAATLETEVLLANEEIRLVGQLHESRRGESKGGFTRLDLRELGIEIPEFLPSDVLAHYLRFGLGLAAGDYDRDGWVDFVVGTRSGPVLFKNLGGLRFAEAPITLAEGSRGLEMATVNVALVDIDNDSYLDLYMAAVGDPGRIILNRRGRFEDARVIELPEGGGRLIAYTAAFSDVDRDGLLDLFVGYWTSQDPPRVDDTSENRLFMNLTTGFSRESYRDPYLGSTTSSLFSDLNQDGFTDLVIGNDWETPDEILMGGPGGLKRRPREQFLLSHTPTFSMGYDTGDIDNDGRLDLFAIEADFHPADGPQDICHAIEGLGERRRCEEVKELARSVRAGNAEGCNAASSVELKADCESGVIATLAIRLDRLGLCAKIPSPSVRTFCEFEVRRAARIFVPGNNDIPQQHHNVLFVQPAPGKFKDVSEEWGVRLSHWSWNAKFQDLDNDGWLDILVANGTFERVSPNLHFRNAEGTHFVDTHSALRESISSSAYLAEDFDNDGDLDVLINGINAPYRFFRNDSANAGFVIRLSDGIGNSHGVGAKITIELSGSSPPQIREIKSGGGFLSFASPSAHFGAGEAREIDRIGVVWPDGESTLIEGPLPTDRGYTIERKAGTGSPLPMEQRTMD